MQSVLATEGIRGLYRGFLLQQLTYGPFNGLALMFYNEFKMLVPDVLKESLSSKLICSTLGYSLAAAVTNPFDVVKTRRQVQMSNPEVFNYKSGVDCFMQMVRNEGVSALMAGVTGRIGWLTPRCAIAMTSYEAIMKMV